MVPLIELKNVSKFYSTEENVALGIRHVNVKLFLNDFVAVTGSSGCGKSTLLNVLSGIDDFEEGEFFFNGENITYFKEDQRVYYREQNVAFIFQDYNIIDSYTVAQNVELALLTKYRDKLQRKNRVDEILEKVGLSHRRRHRGSKLSGGEKQRVAIARALAKDAPILFADEPTGNLDTESGKGVIALLAEIAKDRLVVVVTHSFDDVKDYANRILRMDDGEIVEDRRLGGSVSAGNRNDDSIEANSEQANSTEQDSAMADFAEKTAKVENDSEGSEQQLKNNGLRAIPPLDNVKKTIEEVGVELGLQSKVALQNIVATPKKTLFLLTTVIIMTLLLIQVFGNVIATLSKPEYQYGANRLDIVATTKNGGNFTPYEIERIKADKNVHSLYTTNGSFVNLIATNVDPSTYTEIEGSTVNFSFQGLIRPSDSETFFLEAGRYPQSKGEVVLMLRNSDGRDDYWEDNLVNSTVKLIIYGEEPGSILTESDYNGTEGVAPMGFKVVGYGFTTGQRLVYMLPQDIEYRVATEVSSLTVLLKNSSSAAVRRTLRNINDSDIVKAYYPYGLKASLSTMVSAIVQIVMTAVMFCIGYAIVVLVISKSRTIGETKKKDYNIMRTVGLRNDFIKKVYYLEMIITAAFSWLIAIILELIYLAINTPQAADYGAYLKYMMIDSPSKILLLLFVSLAASLALVLTIAEKFSKKFFKLSVKSSLMWEAFND